MHSFNSKAESTYTGLPRTEHYDVYKKNTTNMDGSWHLYGCALFKKQY